MRRGNNMFVRQAAKNRRSGVAQTPAVSAAKPNIIDPTAWGNASAGTVTYNSGTDTANFAAAGNGVNISNAPLIALKANTTYNVSITKTGGSVQLRYGGSTGTLVLWSGSGVIPVGSPSTATFTTGAADLGDGKIYERSSNVGVTAALTGLVITEA